MKILAATRSRGKQEEIRRILVPGGLQVVFPEDIWLRESNEDDALEAADTFEGNARRKAEYFVRLSSLPTLADDSGLEVFALGGAPGVRSKRWAGASGTPLEVDAANNAELLRRIGWPFRCPAGGALSLRAGLSPLGRRCPSRVLR